MDDARPLIFISHVSEDAEATRLLQADLDDRFIGSVHFFNTSSRDALRPGENWLTTITEKIQKSTMVLPVLSPAALRSPWVNFESGGGWINHARIIPCCAGQVRKETLPAPYSWLQAINLDDEDDLSQLVQIIAQEVQLRVRLDGLDELASALRSAFALSAIEVTNSSASLGNRIDKHVERQWKYRRAEHDPTKWGGTYSYKSEVLVTDPTLESILVGFTPAIETVPFTLARAPIPRLGAWTRSSAGSVRLADPHRRTGSGYAFRIYFEPPLREDDVATVELGVDFPEYRLGTREDYILAQLEYGRGAAIKDFQQNSRVISRPTELFIYRVIIPEELGASPLDPSVTRFGSVFADEEQFLRRNSSVYSVRAEDCDGEPCWIMEIKRSNPPYQATYKVRWALPSRKELGLTETSPEQIRYQ